jgi:hypothetical protein
MRLGSWFMPRSIALALALWAACQGAEKKPAEGRVSNDAVEITARAFTDKDEIKKMLGSDLDGGITVVDVRLVPKPGTKLSVIRDDFVLRSDKDGQRSTPFAPSQIAGRGVLVISSTGGGAAMGTQRNGPIWGGPMDRPRRVGGDGASTGTSEVPATATAQPGGKSEENPLLAVLTEKVLPEKETNEPVSGLLYFFLDGKHKPKDFELIYRGAAGKLSLRFKN